MAYTVTIQYVGVSATGVIGDAPIPRYFNPDGSYIDSAVYHAEGIYDTNIDGFGSIPAVAPYDQTSIPFPVALAQFQLAVVGEDNTVEFTVEDYKEAFYYKTIGAQLADQGFVVTVEAAGENADDGGEG